ncbi:MAG: hypothetical protein E6772_08230 [Dysgonomonas sp.]|nr:hypothetical protein [Dysgonomonas sp.]
MKKLTLTSLVCFVLFLIGTANVSAQSQTNHYLGPFYFNQFSSKTYDIDVSGNVVNIQGAPFISYTKGYNGPGHYVLSLDAEDVRIWANSPVNKDKSYLQLEIFFYVQSWGSFSDERHAFYIPLYRE